MAVTTETACSSCENLQEELRVQRQHAGYDFSALAAKNNVTLRDRLKPLIQDAIDALEIETPAPDLSVRRMKAALNVIREAIAANTAALTPREERP